jgi:hypothetical protein
MARAERTGEPYELAGRRLVFTTWRFVRPGRLGWYDDRGRAVTVTGDQGPWEAHFQSIDQPTGIRLRVQPAQRTRLGLEPEHAWEAGGLRLVTWLQEGRTIRAWGTCGPQRSDEYLCYVESDDGVTWRRPRLDLYEHGGNRGNNLLGPADEFGNVFVDPAAPAGERFKWIVASEITREQYDRYRARRPEAWDPAADRVDAPASATHVGAGNLIMALRGAVSPDGLRWTVLPEPLVVQHTDTEVVGYYDSQLRKYVAFVRDWDVGARSRRPGLPDDRGLSWIGVGRRAIGRAETEDFRAFPLSEIVLAPGPEMDPTDVLYTNCYTTVPGAPDHHLMFPAVWHTASDTTSIILASSADGKVWHYLPGDPVLETAPFGEWDGGCVFASPNLVELANGSWALRYRGYNVPHKYPRRGPWRWEVGLAVWPHGRLVALEAPQQGQFATVALLPPGRRLRLNARTLRTGSVAVEVARLDGTPIPGRGFADARPIVGDHAGAVATWSGTDDLGHEEGAPVMLRFRLRQAQLFGLEFPP